MTPLNIALLSGSAEQPARDERGSNPRRQEGGGVQSAGQGGVAVERGSWAVEGNEGKRGGNGLEACRRSKRSAGAGLGRMRNAGFTLIELMIVIAIMLILISIAAPLYSASILRAREAVLHQDLFTMRSLINQYTQDKEKAPQSLDDLVSAGYLKEIPKDPFTNSNSTWQVDQEDVLLSVDQNQDEPGITDVHSGSSAISSEGTPYSQW